jgi:hypothetical protein
MIDLANHLLNPLPGVDELGDTLMMSGATVARGAPDRLDDMGDMAVAPGMRRSATKSLVSQTQTLSAPSGFSWGSGGVRAICTAAGRFA